jgi:Mg/Co/Ni transporter MgtE
MVWQRLSVLVMLLLLQSMSQLVMVAYEQLISSNIIIPLFLTMLVGAGGNAGNQAAVHTITGLVTGQYGVGHMWQLVRQELVAGLISSVCLFCIAFLRVFMYYSAEDVQPTPVFTTVFSISLSLFLIVLTSVVLGSMLPFLLASMRVNVEHAAPMIQVIMDILGVCIACVTCSFFLPAGAGPAAEASADISR